MSGYKYTVKVVLATRAIEVYYIDHDKPKLTIDDFRINDGWSFTRGDGIEWYSADMVKAIQISPFKGFVVRLDKHEIYTASPENKDVIQALESELKATQEKAQAIKDYLSCKS